MARVMRARVVAVLIGAAGAAFSCSAVPDVRFTSDGGADDGDAGDGGDAGGDVTPPSCPDNPPAGAICCDKTICEGCTDCAGCQTAGCAPGDVCCPVGASGKITCKPGTCR